MTFERAERSDAAHQRAHSDLSFVLVVNEQITMYRVKAKIGFLVEKKSQQQWAQCNSSGVAAGAGASEDTVQHQLEARSEHRITTFGEMQPIGRDRHAELSVAVEQCIADFGVTCFLPAGLKRERVK